MRELTSAGNSGEPFCVVEPRREFSFMPPWMSEAWVALLIGLMCLAAPARADDASPICPDRPGKGTSACTVDAGRWQAELGLWDGSFEHRAGITTDTSNTGSLLLKYGVSDNVDLEAGMALVESVRTHDASGTRTDSGLGDLFLHAKWNVDGGGAFVLVLDPYIKLPTAPLALGNGAVEGGLVMPMSYDLGSDWSLAMTPEADILRDGAGGGYHINAVDVIGLGRAFGSLTLGAEVWTAQNFDPAGSVGQYSFDLDAAWLSNADTQLDGGVNVGLNRATPDLELYLGVSRRF